MFGEGRVKFSRSSFFILVFIECMYMRSLTVTLQLQVVYPSVPRTPASFQRRLRVRSEGNSQVILRVRVIVALFAFSCVV